MSEPEVILSLKTGRATDADRAPESVRDFPRTEWEAKHLLDLHRAETERLRVLVEFLGRPVHGPGGSEPDCDVITAYNLAVEAALHGIRRSAIG